MRNPVRDDRIVSQRWVSVRSGVSTGTLRNLARIGLLPDAGQLRTADVIVAKVALALGATRCTNRDLRTGQRTEIAQQRDRRAVALVRYLISGQMIESHTLLLASSTTAWIVTDARDLLQLTELARLDQDSLTILPIGQWYGAARGPAASQSL